MKKIVLIVLLITAFGWLFSMPEIILAREVGYTKPEFGCTIGFSFTNPGGCAGVYGFKPRWTGAKYSPYLKISMESKGEPKGFETDEQYYWWVDTEKEIYEQIVISLGNVYALDKKGIYKFAPYLGLGFREYYTQWDTSIGEAYYSSKSIKTLGEAGVDFFVSIKSLLLSLGISAQSGVSFSFGFGI